MTRFLLFAGVIVLSGCQAGPEHLPVQLRDDSPPLAYAELLTRARAQARIATEAFYDNRWALLEDAARGLEQTGRFLQKASDVPPNQKVELPKLTENMIEYATKLKQASMSQNVKETNDILTRVNFTVRELRLDK